MMWPLTFPLGSASRNLVFKIKSRTIKTYSHTVILTCRFGLRSALSGATDRAEVLCVALNKLPQLDKPDPITAIFATQ